MSLDPYWPQDAHDAHLIARAMKPFGPPTKTVAHHPHQVLASAT